MYLNKEIYVNLEIQNLDLTYVVSVYISVVYIMPEMLWILACRSIIIFISSSAILYCYSMRRQNIVLLLLFCIVINLTVNVWWSNIVTAIEHILYSSAWQKCVSMYAVIQVMYDLVYVWHNRRDSASWTNPRS